MKHELSWFYTFYYYYTNQKIKLQLLLQQYLFVTRLKIGGANIPWVTEVRHLGHIITCNLRDTKDIDDKLHAFYGQANDFFGAFPGLSADKAAKLFSTYTSSYYGYEL